jgi:hypothetical protein
MYFIECCLCVYGPEVASPKSLLGDKEVVSVHNCIALPSSPMEPLKQLLLVISLCVTPTVKYSQNRQLVYQK